VLITLSTFRFKSCRQGAPPAAPRFFDTSFFMAFMGLTSSMWLLVGDVVFFLPNARDGDTSFSLLVPFDSITFCTCKPLGLYGLKKNHPPSDLQWSERHCLTILCHFLLPPGVPLFFARSLSPDLAAYLYMVGGGVT